MAWNPFDKSAAEAPTTELPPVDVPVADATAIVPPVPAPQSENLRRAFEAAQREVDDAAPEASASAVPQASVPEASAPAPLRFGGATRFGAQDESVPAPPEPAPSVPEPAPSVWAAAAASVLPTEEPTQVMPAPARAAVGPTDDAVTAEQASLERERAARREARRAALQPVRRTGLRRRMPKRGRSPVPAAHRPAPEASSRHRRPVEGVAADRP